MIRLFWYNAFAGLCCLFVGIGLCRFAYTAIIPALINQSWLNLAAAGYIGTSNLLGYLLAVYLSKRILKYYALTKILKFSLLLAIMSLALCAFNWGFLWLAIWRFAAGSAGAWIMIMTPAAVLKEVPASYKGRAAGIVFTGIGLGIIASGFIFPVLAKNQVANAWFGATGLAIIVSLLAWPALKKPADAAAQTIQVAMPWQPQATIKKSLWLMAIAYLLYGIGMIPHTLFLVAYLHSAFNISLVKSGLFWAVFGIGATIGPLIAGSIADKIGNYQSLLIAFLIAAIAMFLMMFHSLALCFVSTLLMGILLPSIPSLISSRILELIGLEYHPQAWSHTTLYCAISQAIAAYLMSDLLHHAGAYFYCFASAGIIFFLAFLAIRLSAITDFRQ